MAYTVNWTGKIVSIPTSDLTLVSSRYYRLTMSDFLGEIRRLEAEFAEGLWAPQILDHTNGKTLAGTPFAPFDEIINGYVIEFVGALDRVDLVGSNNNIVDVMVPNGVSVVPSNSGGLLVTTVSTGSGLSPEEQAMLLDVYKAHFNRRKHDKDNNILVLYEADKISPHTIFDAADDLSEIDPQ